MPEAPGSFILSAGARSVVISPFAQLAFSFHGIFLWKHFSVEAFFVGPSPFPLARKTVVIQTETRGKYLRSAGRKIRLKVGSVRWVTGRVPPELELKSTESRLLIEYWSSVAQASMQQQPWGGSAVLAKCSDLQFHPPKKQQKTIETLTALFAYIL